MTDLCHLSLVEQARRISVGGTTSVELVEAHLARIDAVEPRVGAFLLVDRDVRSLGASHRPQRQPA
ncbi:MAG: hypothetical protein HC848_04740, partial [Limnobacter sp.]|nr:hypothetical protein [Limnobacter sp.]